MKLKVKIILIFVSSIILSVVIFLFIIAYLMSNGWWAGISNYNMEFAADGISVQITGTDSLYAESNKHILDEWKDKYPGMELELFSDKMESIYTTAPTQQINTLGELLKSLSKHGQFSQDRWVSAREITVKDGEKGYLVVIVPSKYYAAISYSVNMPKGAGIFGQMFLIGLAIALVISGAFAYLFTKGMIRRFNTLYEGISRFDLENMDMEIKDDSNDEIGYLALIFNRMSRRLKDQVDEEKAYQDERKKLVANISHDLRTPLTSIIGYSESLENGVYEGEEEKRKFVSIINKKAIYMNQLLGELLDYSRLESGRYILKKDKIDITELVREILIEYLPALQENNIELLADLPEESLIVNIDKDGISRVLRNIIDNALKYGRNGKLIEVIITEEKDTIKIIIRDNGQGIDIRNLDKIFERFFREDKSRSTMIGGMGLGLAIADEIIKLHNGRIIVASTPGEGTTFTVVLPVCCD